MRGLLGTPDLTLESASPSLAQGLLSHRFDIGFPDLTLFSTVSILGALQRQAVLQGAFVKIADFIKFKWVF